MLEPPGQGKAGRAADGGAEAGFGTRWPDADAGGPGTGASVPAAGPWGPEQAAEPDPPAGRRRGLGRLPAWAGILTVLAAAALGLAYTVASHREPGRMLGTFVVAGTVVAATTIRARSAYAIIPVPALAYTVAAAAAGAIHDRAVDTTHTALVLSAVQWTASGFIAMTAATVLAVLITLARWLLSLRNAR
ncbi:MAG TPA: DUF6542 domain-containing protein [Streptosporangiaceae bacterium]|nr:DUF6542 domain-containing protein [Streptosporangiaceae bacterium]